MGRASAMAIVFTAAASASTLGLLALQELPPGQGREVTLGRCSAACHGIDRVMAEHRSKSQWTETIDTMKDNGAKVSDEEFKAIISYLTAHFGVQVKINTATARQIDDALVLSGGQAAAIVKYRDEHGPFKDWQALLQVPGLDPKALDEQKGNIVFNT
jgi:competence ComEA-like helix-hairpin-helix protein